MILLASRVEPKTVFSAKPRQIRKVSARGASLKRLVATGRQIKRVLTDIKTQIHQQLRVPSVHDIVVLKETKFQEFVLRDCQFIKKSNHALEVGALRDQLQHQRNFFSRT